MDLSSIDLGPLSNLNLVQVLTLTVIITIIDVLGAILLAVVQRKFSARFVAVWLQSHTIKRVFPIFALAWLGAGAPQINVPGIPMLFGAAVAGVGTYLIETITSIQANFADASPPADETPVPPPA